MAWTIAVVLALVSISAILVFLSKSFDNSKQAMKIFLTLLSLASLVVIAQVVKLIIDVKASSTNLVNLQLLSTTSLVVTITLLSFFTAYFFITYTIFIVKSAKLAKQQKETAEWGGV